MTLRGPGVVSILGGMLALVLGCATGGRPEASPAATSEVTSATAAAAEAPAKPSVPTPSAQPLTNTIRWSTASEVDNFGFDVYRGEAEEGPFVRLTTTPIAGAGTSDEPHAYRFVDSTIAPATTYFYYVESISLAGVRERFTPVIRAAAKGLPAATPPGGP